MSSAIVLYQAGPSENLKLETVTVQNPSPGEIKLRQTAVGVNFHDTYVRSGLYDTDGQGVQIAYDAVGKDTFFGSLACLAPCGHLANYGQASGPVPPFEVSALFPKSNSLSRPNVFQHLRSTDKLRSAASRLFEALDQGVLQTGDVKAFQLAEAAQAHREMESRSRLGSVILSI